jgi:hypothetical protein
MRRAPPAPYPRAIDTTDHARNDRMSSRSPSGGQDIAVLTRTLTLATRSRRQIFQALRGTALGGMAWTLDKTGVDARKQHRRRSKAKPNTFGCLDVGQACAGKNSKCCSGICQGKKPRKGRRDKSRCAAHNTGGCLPTQDTCLGTGQACGENGACTRTTGKASFCGVDGACSACQRDADCQALLGPGAACVVCFAFCPDTGTACIPAAA